MSNGCAGRPARSPSFTAGSRAEPPPARQRRLPARACAGREDRALAASGRRAPAALADERRRRGGRSRAPGRSSRPARARAARSCRAAAGSACRRARPCRCAARRRRRSRARARARCRRRRAASPCSARFRERGEMRRADQRDVAALAEIADQRAGVFALHRRLGAEHRDALRARRRAGRLDRRHRADERHGEPRAQMRQHDGRGGVAGDHHDVGRVRARSAPPSAATTRATSASSLCLP